MRPFKVGQRKKNLQLKKAEFNLKDFFAKMIESSDFMHPKLREMLTTNSQYLHAFIELGGLSKIYDHLMYFNDNNDPIQIIKWLEILNHDNFPIDTELIRDIGLGNFINKQINIKWKHLSNLISLTNNIQQKWYKFAKNEKEIHSQREQMQHQRVNIPDSNLLKTQIIFKKTDKPSNISQINGKYGKYGQFARKTAIKQEIASILKSSKNGHKFNNISPNHHELMMDDDNDESDENHNEYTLEYVDIDDDDNDIAMDDNDENTDDDDDDIDLMRNNRNNQNNHNHHQQQQQQQQHQHQQQEQEQKEDEMQHELLWYTPIKLRIDYEANTVNSSAMKMEEERIKNASLNIGRECFELESSSIAPNNNIKNADPILIDYPHWSEIEKYRKENDV